MTATILPVSDQAIARAADALMAGELVAMPTETVYGLAGDATNDAACAEIFAVKGRPSFNPLIAHMATLEMAKDFVVFSETALRLAEAFWPGPLTLVLPRVETCTLSLLTSAGLSTQAVRIPGLKAARDLISFAGRPLAAPSANPSGQLSPTTAKHVAAGLGSKIAMILDNGPCDVGVESTIVKVDGDKVSLLRAGGIGVEDIEKLVAIEQPTPSDKPEAPGMLDSHYAPSAKLRLNADKPYPGEAFLAFGAFTGEAPPSLNLSATGSLSEAAAHLFSYLHQLDATATKIAVAPIPKTGLGLAINDRLQRAAAPRPE